jgi:hypothetical protein
LIIGALKVRAIHRSVDGNRESFTDVGSGWIIACTAARRRFSRVVVVG